MIVLRLKSSTLSFHMQCAFCIRLETNRLLQHESIPQLLLWYIHISLNWRFLCGVRFWNEWHLSLGALRKWFAIRAADDENSIFKLLEWLRVCLTYVDNVCNFLKSPAVNHSTKITKMNSNIKWKTPQNFYPMIFERTQKTRFWFGCTNRTKLWIGVIRRALSSCALLMSRGIRRS